MRIRTFKYALLLLLAAALTLSGAASAAGATLTTVRLSEVVRSVFYAPQYVALSQGFFKDEGLNVELQTAWGGDKVMAALLSHSVDIGFVGPETAVYVYQRGAADYAVCFGQLTAMDGSFLVGRPNETFSWASLKGKTIISLRPGSVTLMTLEWMLRQHGLDPNKDVHLITNISPDAKAAAFTSGVGDYAQLYEPAPSQFEAQGMGKVAASVGVGGGPETVTAYFALKSYTEAHPDVLIAFDKALYRGMKWVAGHSVAETAQAIAPFFPDVDQKTLVAALNRYEAQATWRPSPIISQPQYEHLLDVIAAGGELKSRVPFAAIMNNQFAAKAVAEVDGANR